MIQTITEDLPTSTTAVRSYRWDSTSFQTVSASGGTATEDVHALFQRHRAKPRPDPKRRLRGFVIAFQGTQARVGFVGDDKSVTEYLLPRQNLRHAGITAINQPFEMDEIEESSEGEYSLTYRFRPMAKANSAATDILDTDDDLTELRAAALRHFGESSDD